MKKLLLSILISFISFTVLSQGCLPEGITFTTQEQIDNFQIDNPGCTEIEGDVTISGNDITNLNGLSVLTSVSGDLIIYQNPSLANLTGLDNLTSIGGDLILYTNNSLTNLIGIESLITVEGDFSISGNDNLINLVGLSSLSLIGGDLFLGAFDIGAGPLTNLEGLENLSSIGGMLNIRYNFAIINLTGLENLTSIGGGLVITANYSLLNLNGLEGLTSVGGGLYIGGQLGLGGNNSSLTSLAGLENIDSGSISSLYIVLNENLSTCEVQSICDYLVAPNGDIEIHDNAPGCNSLEEVEEACGIVSINNVSIGGDITASPNPFTTSTTLSYELQQPEKVLLTIYNHLGQNVYQTQENQPQGKQQLIWNAERHADGIYCYRMQAGDEFANGKLVKVR